MTGVGSALKWQLGEGFLLDILLSVDARKVVHYR